MQLCIYILYVNIIYILLLVEAGKACYGADYLASWWLVYAVWFWKVRYHLTGSCIHMQALVVLGVLVTGSLNFSL